MLSQALLWIGVIATVGMGADGPAVQIERRPQVREGVPCVYIDRSHEWLFAYDDLGDRMLVPAGFDAVLSDTSLAALGELRAFAVVVVVQGQTPSPVSREEAALLGDYVKGGGSLLLVTRPGMPLESLARGFGFRLAKQAGQGPLRCAKALVEQGSPAVAQTRLVPAVLVGRPGQTPLVADARGVPVAAATKVGKGTVVVWADDLTYWDFCAQRGPDMKVPSAPTTVALLRWMSPARPADRPGRAERFSAEHAEEFGPMRIRYSNPNAPQVARVKKLIPRIIQSVERVNGRGVPKEGLFTIHFLSGGGGGWAGGHDIGICVIGDEAYTVKVIAHEMTHTVTGPMPWAFGEAWAVVAGLRAAEQLGYRKSADQEYREIIAQFKRADPKGNRLDLMQSGKTKTDHAYQCKAVWIYEQLERRYGRDFMPRFLKAREQKYGDRKAVDLTQTLDLFAEVSGDKGIYGWYQQIGTSLPPPDRR